MEILKQKILDYGVLVSDQILKVDSFLNHQLDPDLIIAIGKEFAGRFGPDGVTKILTVEASGIPVALTTAMEFKIPVVFAKKNRPSTLQGEVFTAKVHSFTKNEDVVISVSGNYLSADDRILIIDDFLAMGSAAKGLVDIVRQAGATLIGVGVVIEKGFQRGGEMLRASGVRVEPLVTIKSLKTGEIEFA